MIKHKKPLRAKVKKTYVAFVLDKSGSMASVKDATIVAFNEQLQEHRKSGTKGGLTTLSLVQFSGNVEETFFNIPIDEIDGELDASQYSPAGSTALYDAVGYTVNKLQRFDEAGDVGFLVIVISDGQENASRKFDGHDIASLRKELESTGRWTFQYIGSDPNAITEVQKLGFNSFKFESTEQGWQDLSKNLVGSTQNYYAARSAGACSVDSFMVNPNKPESS